MVIVEIVLVIIILYIIRKYNILIKLKNKVKQSESSIDIYLNQRFDLIPNLIDCVKGYTSHESGVLENITKMRSEYLKDKNSIEKAQNLNNSINNVLAVAEAYPELKADSQYLNLQKSLEKIENELISARNTYNYHVTAYNTKIEMIPTNLIASVFGMKKALLFQIEEYKKDNIRINGDSL